VLELIQTRRSIRTFSDFQVSDDLVDKVLEAGRWAPSGMDNQPWRFAVIRDTELKEKVSRLTRYGRIILSANILIAVFLDTASIYHRTKDVQAIGACIENMLLALHSLGLGGVWLGEILKSAKELKELLAAPEAYELMAVIALGYPAGPHPEPTGRKRLSELIFFRK
jgi:nitroreductase